MALQEAYGVASGTEKHMQQRLSAEMERRSSSRNVVRYEHWIAWTWRQVRLKPQLLINIFWLTRKAIFRGHSTFATFLGDEPVHSKRRAESVCRRLLHSARDSIRIQRHQSIPDT